LIDVIVARIIWTSIDTTKPTSTVSPGSTSIVGPLSIEKLISHT